MSLATSNCSTARFDFDVSVRVEGEDYEINGYLGSEDYMAPEIRAENSPRQMYSPIRADRYSCGRVFQRFAREHNGIDEGLAAFARKLMDLIPRNRPRLTEWCKPNALRRDADDGTMASEDETSIDVKAERKIERPLKRLRRAESDLDKLPAHQSILEEHLD